MTAAANVKPAIPTKEAQRILAQLHAEITFDHGKHTYTTEATGPIPSVTTILGRLDKPALKWWAANLQQTADKEAFAEFSEKGGNIDDYLARVKGAFNRTARAEADYGSEAHSLIEWHCKLMLGVKTERPTVSDRGEAIFGRAEEWMKEVELQPVAVETRFASRKHRFAGTADIMATTNLTPNLSTIDWKGRDLKPKDPPLMIYPEARLQNIAYRGALREYGIISDGIVVRLPKIGPDWNVEPVPVPWDENAWEAFVGLIPMHNWLKGQR